MIYNKNSFEHMLFENLQTTEEIMEDWRKKPYYEDSEMSSQFWKEIKKAPAVAVIGDYDVDGICGVYIMGKSIKSVCPEKKILLRIPRRFSEGYGINEAIVEEIIQKYPKGTVVVTVDNGIAAASTLEKLESLGYPVLMTDHHKLRNGSKIPNVTFAVDPKVDGINSGFSYKNWCGAAVAFKLCEQFIPEKLAKELEVFAGVATVADSMELKGANWGLVNKAIDTFRKGKAPANLTNIVAALGQDPLFVSEDTFGWYLGPCLNAPGRLEDKGASMVLSYLYAPTEEKLNQIVQYNTTRKKLRDSQLEEVVAIIEREGRQNDCPIWVVADGLHEGIIGILAGKISEKYGVPAIIGTHMEGNPEYIKASGRGVGDFNLLEYLSYVPEEEIRRGKYGAYNDNGPKEINDATVKRALDDWYVKMGGHEAAAGLTMTVEKWEKASKKQAEKPHIDTQKQYIDITADNICEICEIKTKFAPFGEGNPEPLFNMEFDFQKENGKMVGDFKNHLMAGPKDRAYKIQHFYHDPNSLSDKLHFGMSGTIANSAFRGIETPTFDVEEIYDLEAERTIETDTYRDNMR